MATNKAGVYFRTCQDPGLLFERDAGNAISDENTQETLFRVSGHDLFWMVQNEGRLMAIGVQGLNEIFESFVWSILLGVH